MRLEMLLLRSLETGLGPVEARLGPLRRSVRHRVGGGAIAVTLAVGPRRAIRSHRRSVVRGTCIVRGCEVHRPASRAGGKGAIAVEHRGSRSGRDGGPAMVVIGAQRVIC